MSEIATHRHLAQNHDKPWDGMRSKRILRLHQAMLWGIYKSDVSSLRQTVGIRSLHWTWKIATGTPNLLRPNVTGVVIYKHSQAFIWSYIIIYPFSEVNPWVTKPTVQSISQRKALAVTAFPWASSSQAASQFFCKRQPVQWRQQSWSKMIEDDQRS